MCLPVSVMVLQKNASSFSLFASKTNPICHSLLLYQRFKYWLWLWETTVTSCPRSSLACVIFRCAFSRTNKQDILNIADIVSVDWFDCRTCFEFWTNCFFLIPTSSHFFNSCYFRHLIYSMSMKMQIRCWTFSVLVYVPLKPQIAKERSWTSLPCSTVMVNVRKCSAWVITNKRPQSSI